MSVISNGSMVPFWIGLKLSWVGMENTVSSGKLCFDPTIHCSLGSLAQEGNFLVLHSILEVGSQKECSSAAYPR